MDISKHYFASKYRKRAGCTKNSVKIKGKNRNWYAKNKAAKKIQQQKESRRGNFESHIGLESIAASNFALDALAKYAGINVSDIIVREIEGAILLLTNLSQQTTVLGVTSAIGLHLRAYAKTSMYKVLMDYVKDMFPKEEQVGMESHFDSPQWLTCLRSIRQNWTLCKNNKAFSQVSKLLGILVTLGLCKAADLDFSLENLRCSLPIYLRDT